MGAAGDGEPVGLVTASAAPLVAQAGAPGAAARRGLPWQGCFAGVPSVALVSSQQASLGTELAKTSEGHWLFEETRPVPWWGEGGSPDIPLGFSCWGLIGSDHLTSRYF